MADRGYYEIAFSFSRRGRTIETTQIKEAIEHAHKNGSELYRSYFTLSNEARDYVQEKKTLSNCPARVRLDSLLFDIDKGEMGDVEVLAKARKFFRLLIDAHGISPYHIRVFYSGTGYHIETPDFFNFPTVTFEEILHVVKPTLIRHFPMADDLYYGTSLIRVPFTINKKTNRYKILLDHNFFLSASVEDIIKASETKPTIVDFAPWDAEEDVPDFSKEIIDQRSQESNVKLPDHKTFKALEVTKMVTCVQNMYKEGPKKGHRHNTMMRMISSFRRQGVPMEGVLAMMMAWDKTMPKEEITKFVKDVYEKGYRYSCHDSVMAAHCDANCRYFQKKNYTMDIADNQSMVQQYRKYITKLKSSKIIDLATLYNMDTFRCLPSEFIVVTGDTGIGKTAWVQNLAVELKVKTLYISVEVGQDLLFRRFMQIANGLSKEEVDTAFTEIPESIVNAMAKKFDHVKVVTVPPSLNAIEKIIIEEEPELVIIDTLDGIDEEGQITDLTRTVALGLKRIANLTNTIILGIHHISKNAAIDEKGKSKQLNVHSLMGSSALEQKADKVIAVEAINGDKTNPIRMVTSLKARDEKPFSLTFKYAWETFQYNQLLYDLKTEEDDNGEFSDPWLSPGGIVANTGPLFTAAFANPANG